MIFAITPRPARHNSTGRCAPMLAEGYSGIISAELPGAQPLGSNGHPKNRPSLPVSWSSSQARPAGSLDVLARSRRRSHRLRQFTVESSPNAASAAGGRSRPTACRSIRRSSAPTSSRSIGAVNGIDWPSGGSTPTDGDFGSVDRRRRAEQGTASRRAQPLVGATVRSRPALPHATAWPRELLFRFLLGAMGNREVPINLMDIAAQTAPRRGSVTEADHDLRDRSSRSPIRSMTCADNLLNEGPSIAPPGSVRKELTPWRHQYSMPTFMAGISPWACRPNLTTGHRRIAAALPKWRRRFEGSLSAPVSPGLF